MLRYIRRNYLVDIYRSRKMYPGGYTAEVTCLSPIATENEIFDFFSHCGEIEYVDVIRSGENACTAYVTFRDAYALETAVLLSGATISGQQVYISRWGTHVDDSDLWNNPALHPGYENSSTNSTTTTNQFVSTPGEAVTVAQEAVKTMIAKGFILSKDALTKAKALDESYQVSSTATAKIADISNRIGLTDKICAGVEVVRYVDEKYRVRENTTTAVSYTGKTAVTAVNAVVNSSYFSKGALWVSSALNRAAKVAADLGTHGINK